MASDAAEVDVELEFEDSVGTDVELGAVMFEAIGPLADNGAAAVELEVAAAAAAAVELAALAAPLIGIGAIP